MYSTRTRTRCVAPLSRPQAFSHALGTPPPPIAVPATIRGTAGYRRGRWHKARGGKFKEAGSFFGQRNARRGPVFQQAASHSQHKVRLVLRMKCHIFHTLSYFGTSTTQGRNARQSDGRCDVVTVARQPCVLRCDYAVNWTWWVVGAGKLHAKRLLPNTTRGRSIWKTVLASHSLHRTSACGCVGSPFLGIRVFEVQVVKVFREYVVRLITHPFVLCRPQVYDACSIFLLRSAGARRVAPLRPRRPDLHALHQSHPPICRCLRSPTAGRRDWRGTTTDNPHGQGMRVCTAVLKNVSSSAPDNVALSKNTALPISRCCRPIYTILPRI